jgi:PBP1b-binding outer membrane lipoprotein LpoB
VTVRGMITGKVALQATYNGDSDNSGSYRAKALTIEP